MKRIILSILLMLGCLKGVIAQNVKPVRISIYPVLHDPRALLKSINEKLKPYQKGVTSMPLVNYFGRTENEVNGYDDEKGEEEQPFDKKEKENWNTIADIEGLVSAAYSPGDSIDMTYLSYVQVNPADGDSVMLLLNLAKEKELYDTSRYFFTIQPTLDCSGWDALYVLDMKVEKAIPTVSFTDFTIDKNEFSSDYINIRLTNESWSQFKRYLKDGGEDKIFLLIDGEVVWMIDEESVIGERLLSIICPTENRKENVQFVKRLKASVIEGTPYKPLLPLQYALGDTLTYKIKVSSDMPWIEGEHTFKIVPLEVNDDVCRLEYTVNDFNVKTSWDYLPENKDEVDFETGLTKQMIKQHFIIEANNTTGQTTIKIKDKEGFEMFLKNFKKQISDDLKNRKLAKKIVDKRMRMSKEESVMYDIDQYMEDESYKQFIPELDVISAIINRFSEGDKAGRDYFKLFKDVGSYDIVRDKKETIITLKSAPDSFENTTDAYEYHFDAKGNLLKVKGNVKKTLYYKEFVIERLEQ